MGTVRIQRPARAFDVRTGYRARRERAITRRTSEAPPRTSRVRVVNSEAAETRAEIRNASETSSKPSAQAASPQAASPQAASPQAAPPPPVPPPAVEALGTYLRNERELRQLTLEEIAQSTRIPIKMLQRIEDDRLDELPGDVFARGFLKSYAQVVGLDADEVLERFASEVEADAEEAPSGAPMTAITPPERGRRFGIAIGLVILIILFTLAFSIVLRPRPRDTPIELAHTVRVVDVAVA